MEFHFHPIAWLTYCWLNNCQKNNNNIAKINFNSVFHTFLENSLYIADINPLILLFCFFSFTKRGFHYHNDVLKLVKETDLRLRTFYKFLKMAIGLTSKCLIKASFVIITNCLYHLVTQKFSHAYLVFLRNISWQMQRIFPFTTHPFIVLRLNFIDWFQTKQLLYNFAKVNLIRFILRF